MLCRKEASVITITITRKPLDVATPTVAANALKWGTGGINVDASRIGLASAENPQKLHARSGGRRGFREEYVGGGSDGPLFAGWDCAKGRWPANLILSHLPGCRCTGVAKLTPKEGHRPNPVAVQSDGKIQFLHKPPGYQKVSYTGEDGMETVEAWDCVVGCPVAALDDQSGDLAKQGSPKITDTKEVSVLYGGGAISTFYGDTGGASRFFKTVKPTGTNRQECHTMTPSTGGNPAPEDLCPGIRRTVAWLQELGFQTTDSGDGISNEGMECAIPFPNVAMVCQPDRLATEADRLFVLLAGRGVMVEPCSPEEPGPPQIQASYDPANGVAVLVLTNVDDKLLFPGG